MEYNRQFLLRVVRLACRLDDALCFLEVVERRPDVECFERLLVAAHIPAAVFEDRHDGGDRWPALCCCFCFFWWLAERLQALHDAVRPCLVDVLFCELV